MKKQSKNGNESGVEEKNSSTCSSSPSSYSGNSLPCQTGGCPYNDKNGVPPCVGDMINYTGHCPDSGK